MANPSLPPSATVPTLPCPECCSLHVLEVPVEVEVHHCPSPTGGPSLFPELAAALGVGVHHPKLASTRSMPVDLARAGKKPLMMCTEQPQQICLTEHGQFIVRRETQPAGSVAEWAVDRRSFRSKHRCSLVVPLQMPCGECRVQISSEGEEEEEGEERGEASASSTSGPRTAERDKSEEDTEKTDEQSSAEGGGGSRKPSTSGEFSVVRQNLLGPLSFDDLYYIT